MTRFLLGLVLYAVAMYASAFDSWEHKRLSDLAYHLAVEIHCPNDASDVTCADLRPETMVDLSNDGALAMWCKTKTEETEKTAALKTAICIKRQNLYFEPPAAAYAESELAKICPNNPKDKTACAEARQLLDTTKNDAPVLFYKQKELQRWCVKHTADVFCNNFKEMIKIEAQALKGIIRGCYHINDKTKCELIIPARNTRLSWASFFDDLSRDSELTKVEQEGEKYDTKYDSTLTYGDVTMCVDYFLTPEKLMAGSETSLWYPTEDAQVNSLNHLRQRQLYPTRREDLNLSITKRCDDSYWNLEGARSSHVNHTHFQSELLISQRSQHLLALSLHAIECNRMAALTANAISDHYLQDSFAPGHITTWRSRLTDLAANAYHDARNRKGLSVIVDEKRFDQMMKDSGGGAPLDKRVMHLFESDTQTSRSKKARAYFLYSGRTDVNCDKFFCTNAQPPMSDKQEAEKIKEVLGSLRKKLQKLDQLKDPGSFKCNDERCVRFHGDSELWEISQNEQRMLLLLVQVRSILDVLESLPGPADRTSQFTITDSFKQDEWTWYATEEESPSVWERTIRPQNSSLVAKIGPVNYQITQSVDGEPKYDHGYRLFDPVYGFSLGFDSMAFGDQQTRWTLAFERVLFGFANEKRDSVNFAAVAGIEKFREPESNGYGLTSRLSLVFPQTETIFSVSFREIKVGSVDWYKRWRPTYGLRVDQGFTSFATIFFQISRDAAAQKSGRIDSGISVGAGVQIAAPECRIPLVKNMCR